MIHHRLRSLRMSALAARASRVCLSCSLTWGAFTAAGLAQPLLTSDDHVAGEVVSQAGNSQANTAQSAQTSTTQTTPPQQANPPQAQSQQGANPPQGQSQQQRTPPQTPPPPTRPNNPFENVPTTPETTPKPAEKQNPTGIQEAQTAPVGDNIIEGVEFRGQRKVPQDTLRALIYTKKGDVYDEESLHRDFIALWNTGRFDDLKIEKEKGPGGGIILRFVVTERRTVHTIDYTGNKSISKSEILDRLKERKVV